MKRIVKLGEISKIVSGGTPSRSNSAYWGGDIPWVKTTQVNNGHIGQNDIDEWITEKGMKESSAKMMASGTILMAMYGQGKTRGQVGILDIDATINQACAAILLDKNVNRDFLFQQLCHKYQIIRQMSNAGGQENLSADIIRNVRISLPEIAEQRAIAELLSTWDAAIEKTERLIASKEIRFRWLTNFLINEQKEKTNWRSVRLGEVFRERNEANRPDLRLLSISRNEGVIPHDETDRKDNSNEDKSKYLRICPGDIGYNTMRMWQGVSALSVYEGIISPAYTVCTPNKDIDGVFASHLFKIPFMIHCFYRHSQGLTSDTWNLKYHHFAEIKASLPPIAMQKEIAAVLSSAQNEIKATYDILGKLNIQKRGLMQKLLTGEWRVKAGAN